MSRRCCGRGPHNHREIDNCSQESRQQPKNNKTEKMFFQNEAIEMSKCRKSIKLSVSLFLVHRRVRFSLDEMMRCECSAMTWSGTSGFAYLEDLEQIMELAVNVAAYLRRKPLERKTTILQAQEC